MIPPLPSEEVLVSGPQDWITSEMFLPFQAFITSVVLLPTAQP
ncbi:MAG: hypothetical protein QMB47_02680 [Bacteroidales bacterium]